MSRGPKGWVSERALRACRSNWEEGRMGLREWRIMLLRLSRERAGSEAGEL